MKRRIKQAIDKEIAEAEAKARKEQKKAEAKTTSSSANKTESKGTSSETKTPERNRLLLQKPRKAQRSEKILNPIAGNYHGLY